MSRVRLLVCGLALASVAPSTGCGAKDPSSLHIVNLRVEEPAPGASPDLLFAVDNGLSTNESLVSIASPDAASVTVRGADGQTLDGTGASIAVPAQRPTRFEPGSNRAQLTGPIRQLEAGDEVQVVFSFGSGTQIKLVAPVVERGAAGPDPGHR